MSTSTDLIMGTHPTTISYVEKSSIPRMMGSRFRYSSTTPKISILPVHNLFCFTPTAVRVLCSSRTTTLCSPLSCGICEACKSPPSNLTNVRSGADGTVLLSLVYGEEASTDEHGTKLPSGKIDRSDSTISRMQLGIYTILACPRQP